MAGFKFKPTKRGNPCTICGDTSGDCRDNGELLLCHSFIDGGSAPAGWKWIGQTKDGLWGKFLPSTNSDGSSWQDRIEERNQQRQQAQADRQRKCDGGLSLQERDINARKLLKQCPLTPKDKAALIARGIPENLLHLFGSVYRGKVVLGISERFPGIFTLRGGGQSVLLARDINSGILCPVFSPDGLIIGFQVRVNGATDNKYRWLKSGYSSHLQNGELPLTYVGDASSDCIQFAEGVLKPFIIGTLSGIATIGAAGGNFATENSLKQLNQLLAGKKSASLIPDAGAIVNEKILLQYLHLQQFLASRGIPLNVWWWEQWDKSSLDGDQLLAAGRWGEASLISWEAFIALASPETQAYLYPPTPIDSEAEEAEYQRQLEEDEAYQQHQDAQADAEVEEEERKKQQAKEAWESQKAHLEWLRWIDRKKFTPTEEVNQEFLDIDFGMGQCLAVASITGTGKTQWVIRQSLIHKFGFFNLGSRNSLMQNTSERCCQAGLNSYWIHEGDASTFIPDKDSVIHLCIDSLLKIAVSDAEGRVIVIDETVSVLFHALASSTCQPQRSPMLRRLDNILGVSGGLILLDANLSDWIVEAIYKRCRHLKLRKIKNNYRPLVPWNVTLIDGAVNANGIKNSLDKSPLIGELLKTDQYMAIASDSQKAVEVLSGLLDARHVEIDVDPGDVVPISGFRVDSETTGEDLIKEFLKNPNAAIEKYCPGYVAYSPTAESGLDISLADYFRKQFVLLYWQNVDAQMQLMGRIRNCDERIVALPEFTGGDSEMFLKAHNSVQIERAVTAYCELISEIHSRDSISPEESHRLIQELIASNQTESGWEDTWCKFTAMHNYERHNMQKCLKWRLEEAGHRVTVVTAGHDTAASDEFKAERDNVLDTKSNTTFGAVPMDSVDAARKVLSSFGASVTDRRRAEKTLLLHYLPGIEATPSWSPQLVRRLLHDDKYWRSRLERFFLLQHPEIARNISLGFWDNAINNKSEFFIPDKLKDRGLQVWALEELKLLDFINSTAVWTDDSPEIEALVAAGKNKRIVDALGGINPGKGGGINYLGRLLKLVGLALKNKKVRDGDGTIREYSISTIALNDPERLDVLACIEAKFNRRDWYYQQSPPPEKSVAPFANSLRQNEKGATGSNADSEPVSGVEIETYSTADFDPEIEASALDEEEAAPEIIVESPAPGEEEEVQVEDVIEQQIEVQADDGTLRVGDIAVSITTGEKLLVTGLFEKNGVAMANIQYVRDDLEGTSRVDWLARAS
jgi:hypothetical protein